VGLVRWDQDENFHGGGMAGWNEKLQRDAGLKKPMLDPHIGPTHSTTVRQ